MTIFVICISCYISEMIQDSTIVTGERQRNSYAMYRMVPFPVTLRHQGRDIIQHQITRKLYKTELWLQ